MKLRIELNLEKSGMTDGNELAAFLRSVADDFQGTSIDEPGFSQAAYNYVSGAQGAIEIV